MKYLLNLILILFALNVNSQTTYIANSVNIPTSVSNPSVLMGCNPTPSGQIKVYIKNDIIWETYNINGLETYIYTKGDLKYKPITYTPSYAEITSALGYTPYDNSNPAGYINTEVDPVWSGVSANYRTKTQNDLLYQPIGSYLTSEVDPTVPAYSKTLSAFSVIKTSTDALYEPIFSKNTAFNKNFGTTSGTTTEGNDSRVLNGQTAFSWGNHALAGYITASSTNTLTNKSGNISQWTNDSNYLTSVPAQSFASLTGKPTTLSGYGITDAYPLTGNPSAFLTGITSGQVTGALGFTPVTNARTITINGTTFDLTANRTWTVGDLVSSGSYANPSWITSLAYSKLTGTPTIPSNTSQISESTNLYYTDARSRSAISLTTTGSGTATYSNSTGVLNIPTGTSYTAGTGIGISAGVISNTAPDQTVTLTAGNRISITGTYPNFTISYVEPTINTPVARTVNSNFTISATKQATVTYTLTCQVTNPLLVGTSTAMAYLEYSVNAGSTWLLPSQNGNSSGVGITVTLQLTNGQTGTLIGVIPANALVRIRTATSGTGSVTYVTGQEVY